MNGLSCLSKSFRQLGQAVRIPAMFWYVAFGVLLLVVMLGAGLISSSDIRGDLTWKQWLQTVGGGAMLAALLPGRTAQWRFHPYIFLVGALLFLSSFITWKPTNPDD